MTSVLCVPQWQGSGRSDARRLAAGARATAALFPAEARVDVPIGEDAGVRRAGVDHLDVLVENLARIRAARSQLGDRLTFVAGGDCGVELAPVAAAVERHGPALTLLWLDAHADLNTPQSSPSGAFHGMVLRCLLGDGPPELVPARPLAPAQVVLAGVRALDPPEAEFIAQAGLRRVGVGDIGTIAGLSGPVYVHLDLDVLDPTSFGGISCPEPAGVAPGPLAAVLAQIPDVVGASITEHAPLAASERRDAAALRALIAALDRG